MDSFKRGPLARAFHCLDAVSYTHLDVYKRQVGQVSVDAPGSVNYGSGDFDTASIPKVVSVVVYATYAT